MITSSACQHEKVATDGGRAPVKRPRPTGLLTSRAPRQNFCHVYDCLVCRFHHSEQTCAGTNSLPEWNITTQKELRARSEACRPLSFRNFLNIVRFPAVLTAYTKPCRAFCFYFISGEQIHFQTMLCSENVQSFLMKS